MCTFLQMIIIFNQQLHGQPLIPLWPHQGDKVNQTSVDCLPQSNRFCLLVMIWWSILAGRKWKGMQTMLFWQQQYFCGWFLLTQRRSWLIDMSELLRDMSYFMCVLQRSKKKSKLVFCSFQENVPLLFVCCTSKSQNHLGKGRGWRFSKDLASSLPASYSIPHTQTLARAEEKLLFVLLDLSLDIWFK